MDSSLQSIGNLALVQATAPGTTRQPHNIQAIDKAAKDFESVFMSQMLQPMFEGMKVDPVFGGGHGEEVMRTFLVQEYGKIMANTGHLGLADSVKAQMIKAQGITSGNGETHAN